MSAQSNTGIIFKSLVNVASNALLVITEKKEILAANQAAASLFGYSIEELNNKPLEILLPENPPVQNIQYKDKINPLPLPLVPVSYITAGIKKSREIFPVEIKLSPVATINGLVLIAGFNDLTVQQETDEVLKKKQNKF